MRANPVIWETLQGLKYKVTPSFLTDDFGKTKKQKPHPIFKLIRYLQMTPKYLCPAQTALPNCRSTYPTCTSKSAAPNPKSSSSQTNPFQELLLTTTHRAAQAWTTDAIEDLSLSSHSSTIILSPFAWETLCPLSREVPGFPVPLVSARKPFSPHNRSRSQS